jgi:hypothetical protein
MRVHELAVPDDGRDLTAYLAAARQLTHGRVCFVNSHSTIRAPGWLGLLCRALDTPGCGLAGATGSWASHRSIALWGLRLPNGYRDSLADRGAMALAMRSVAAPGGQPQSEIESPPRLRRVRAALDVPREIFGYAGFPAPHVRTNAFVIDRELLLSLRCGALRTRSAAYHLESGTRGITAQVRRRGLAAVVVGRDGVALEADDWAAAELFWQGTQRELLVADNQTRAYDRGGPAVRDALARSAWGPRARSA